MSATPAIHPEPGRRYALLQENEVATPLTIEFNELVVLAARICGTPVALVTLIDRESNRLKAHHGLEPTEAESVMAICARALNPTGDLLIVPDAQCDERFSANPFFVGGKSVRFYAGVPLCPIDKGVVGTLCVIDYEPHRLTREQEEALRVLGRQVVAHLELRVALVEASRNLARLENSQRIAGIGDWNYDFAEQRLHWSDEVYRLLGLSRSDAPPNSATFYRQVHPDDLEFVHREKLAAAGGLRRVDFEHRIIRANGEVRYVHQVAEMLFDAAGQPLRETGTVRDITQRKLADIALAESEERFKFVARAVSDIVWDWNLQTDILWRNEGFLKALGYDAGEISSSVESWTEHIHPSDRSRVVAGLRQAIAGTQDSWQADYRFQRKDGSYAFVEDRGHILRDAAGKGLRMVGGMRDLTEQKERETQHLRAERMESIGTLAGGIAHDLNNVLAPIMMAIELLRVHADQDEARIRILDTILGSCRRGTDLVRQVLTFARGTEGEQVAIRMRLLLDEIAGAAKISFPANVRVVTQASEDLWSVTGDPSQLHQVLLNLAVNARDAMPFGGTLTLTATNAEYSLPPVNLSPAAKSGRYVRVQVTDTGEGIPAAAVEHIFEAFFTTKEPGKGTGLGLATVHAVVKSHGGFVTVESTLGRGTTFTVYLPAGPESSAEAVTPLPAVLPRGNGELLLVIDDDQSILEITQCTLRAFGYRVLTAGNGAEGVALFAENAGKIALVLTDLTMPVMDGAAAIEAIWRIQPGSRIIAASGIDSGESFDRVAGAGVHDFLTKPYSAETLLVKIRQVLDRQGIRQF